MDDNDEVEKRMEQLSGQMNELRKFVSQTVAKAETAKNRVEELEDEIEDLRDENEKLHDRLQRVEGTVSGLDSSGDNIDDILESIDDGDYVGTIGMSNLHGLADRFNRSGYVDVSLSIKRVPNVPSSAPVASKAAISAAVIRNDDDWVLHDSKTVEERIADEILGCQESTAKKIVNFIASNWSFVVETSTADYLWMYGFDDDKIRCLYDIIDCNDLPTRHKRDLLGMDDDLFNDKWSDFYSRYPVEKASEANIRAFIEKREEQKSTVVKTDGWEYGEWVDARDGTYLTPSDLRAYLHSGYLPDNVDPL
jgi:hypothetical protein